jgi:hypothetical protein
VSGTDSKGHQSGKDSIKATATRLRVFNKLELQQCNGNK